jgi:glycerophosphoryl diester phosphodiesterase
MRSANAAAFRLIAHRGASAAAPENTRAAFRLAAMHGAREIETDVRCTSDGRVVLFHDRTLSSKLSRAGRAEDLTLAELESLDIGAWFDRAGAAALNDPAVGWNEEPPALFSPEYVLGFDDYLDEFGDRFHHNIELKGVTPDLPRAVLASLDARGQRSRCTFTSFHLGQLERLRALAPDATAGWLFPRAGEPRPSPETVIRECRRLGLQQCNPRFDTLTEQFVGVAHDDGLEIRPFGIRTPADLREAVNLGTDGATVDWFRASRRLLAGEQLAAAARSAAGRRAQQ